MRVGDKQYHTIWLKEDDRTIVRIIDQRHLPFRFIIEDISTVEEMFTAIKDMHLRGAPLIGAAGALGMYLSVTSKNSPVKDNAYFRKTADYLISSRPTAINLEHCVNRVLSKILESEDLRKQTEASLAEATAIIDEELENCRSIGEFGLTLIEKLSHAKNGDTVNILTHCNAGWLACIDYGTATAPIYFAHNRGIKVHVWVDETRPRNQGARLTAWELGQHGVPHTIIADNTGGHLMQHGMVDMVIVGSDRTTVTGDVANKIGTYLKALAAKDNGIPFYVALPSSTFDWKLTDGINQIPVEIRNSDEIRFVEGTERDQIRLVNTLPENSAALNYGFDVTPARLVTALITERGICAANQDSIVNLFPEKRI
ncbi:MAG TPA: S-methyl-5-thioribose-1-phosphate isomerase [Bacteroidales bacterium]|nr:S-methyl-5-thioribose-1-phosphate isomerase [Bacteroidales bacterium]